MSTEDIVSVSARDGMKSELRVFRAPTSATVSKGTGRDRTQTTASSGTPRRTVR